MVEGQSRAAGQSRDTGRSHQRAGPHAHRQESRLGEIIVGIAVIVIVVLAVMFAASAVKIVQEYERGVIFRLGRIQGAKGPGLFFIVPIIDKMTRIDLRTVTLEVPPQEVITKDNVTVKVTAVVFFRVLNPNDAVIKVADYMRATSQISQTTLRSALGQAD